MCPKTSSINGDKRAESIPDVVRAAYLIRDGLVIYNNGPVYALIGNARNEDLQTKIKAVKSDDQSALRGLHQPVSWAVSFRHPQARNIYDTVDVRHPGLRRLMDDPDRLNDLFGGIAFLRGRVNSELAVTRKLPACLIDPANQTVQIWSPVGNPQAEDLLGEVIRLGGEPVVTSANVSGKPEIASDADISEFRARTGLPLIKSNFHATDPDRLRSSYAIIEVTSEGFRPCRTGYLGLDVILRLLQGYPLADFDPRRLPVPAYPDNVLHLEDLPPDARRATGATIRKYVLDKILG